MKEFDSSQGGGRIRRRRVVILGAYGTANVGDEAILESILSTLARLGPGVDVTVLSNDPSTTQTIHGVPSVFAGWRRGLFQKIRLFQSAHMLICGGGGLLQDTFPNRLIRGPAPRYSLLMLLARACGCRVVVYGQGIGPLRTRYGRWITARALQAAEVVLVRDRGSAELVREITGGRVLPRSGADPAALLEPVSREDALALAAAHGMTEPKDERTICPRVAVCPRPWFHRPDVWPGGDGRMREYVARTARLVRAISEQSNALVWLLPFDLAEDAAVCQEIRRQAGPEAHVRVLAQPVRPRRMLGLVSLADALVGTRLHSLIFATRVGVPFIGIGYDPKVSHFLRDMDLEDSLVDIESFDPREMAGRIAERLASHAETRRQFERARERLLSGAQEMEGALIEHL